MTTQPLLLLSLQARVPSLCRAGVTSACRSAVQALACIDPLKQLLAAKGMLEVGAGTWTSGQLCGHFDTSRERGACQPRIKGLGGFIRRGTCQQTSDAC